MKKVRIGLLIDDFDVHSWAFKMVESIIAEDCAIIAVVVKKESENQKKKITIFSRLKKNWHILFYILYRKIENYLFKDKHDAFAYMDIRSLTGNVPVLEVKCLKKKYSDYILESDVNKLKEYDVDVFLRIGFRILRGEILKAGKLGIWSYHHGDNHFFRGGPAGFWEVIQKKRELGSILQILTEDLDGGEVLYRSWSTVHTSINETLNRYYWKTSAFIPRKIKELYKLGPAAFLEKVKNENARVDFYSHKLYTIPGNFKFFNLFVSHFFKLIRRRIWRFIYTEQWILLYSFSKNQEFSKSLYRYKRIMPPKDRYWADPHVVFYEEKHYVFFEELIYAKNKEIGHLCVAEIGKDGIEGEPVVILEKKYHLSFPFIFEHNDKHYLIPESEQNSTIELYEATKFPFEWEFKMNLMENISAVDSTLLYKDNKFWLFTSIKEIEGGPKGEELFIFSSENLFSQEWMPHPFNPVISDVKLARSAGRIFSYNDKLYRPSQDCSFRYGYGIILNEIIEFNDSSYLEKNISEIVPEWADDVLATHTLSFDKGLTFIDALVKRPKYFSK